MHLQGRLGPLAERAYKRFFLASTISSFGDRVGLLALTFAVLGLTGSGTDLGLVLAARQIMEAATLLAGGVWSDRLPRQWILVGAATIQAISQASVATLLLGGWASIPALIGLQAFYGIGGGLVGPATVGLVPQTVRPERLQQANALLSLSRNTMGIVGPAVGGIVIVAASPSLALAVDAATFVAAGLLLTTLRIPRRARVDAQAPFLHELRLGWREFASRTWLWSTVTLFGVSNFVFAAWVVLGPVIALKHLGGAARGRSWEPRVGSVPCSAACSRCGCGLGGRCSSPSCWRERRFWSSPPSRCTPTRRCSPRWLSSPARRSRSI